MKITDEELLNIERRLSDRDGSQYSFISHAKDDISVLLKKLKEMRSDLKVVHKTLEAELARTLRWLFETDPDADVPGDYEWDTRVKELRKAISIIKEYL